MAHLRKAEIGNGSTGHHAWNRRLCPLYVGATDHPESNCKGDSNDHDPSHLEHSWPCCGDVSQPVDRWAFQKLLYLLLHPICEELGVFLSSRQLFVGLIIRSALLKGSLLFLSAPVRKKARSLLFFFIQLKHRLAFCWNLCPVSVSVEHFSPKFPNSSLSN